MTDIRNLRLALADKLKERRDLIGQVGELRHRLVVSEERVQFLERIGLNPLVNRELERMADEIVRAVLERAVKASEAVADQTVESGDYEIGISIPSLHIRRRLFRMAADDFQPDVHGSEAVYDRPIRRVSYDG